MKTTHSSDAWKAEKGSNWAAHLSHFEAMLAPASEPLVSALELDGATRVADIGCGGGGSTHDISKRAPADCLVDGFDVSAELIALASARKPAPRARFRVVDVATDPPPEAAYDRLASRFGVMFFVDPEAAFSNLARWCAPRGRVAFAVWGPPADNPWATTVRDVVGQVAELPLPDPDGPGLFRYAEPDQLVGALERAGFEGVAADDWELELPIGRSLDAEGAARFALSAFSSFRDALDAAGEEARRSARDELTERFSAFEQGGVTRMKARVRVIRATRSPGR